MLIMLYVYRVVWFVPFSNVSCCGVKTKDQFCCMPHKVTQYIVLTVMTGEYSFVPPQGSYTVLLPNSGRNAVLYPIGSCTIQYCPIGSYAVL